VPFSPIFFKGDSDSAISAARCKSNFYRFAPPPTGKTGRNDSQTALNSIGGAAHDSNWRQERRSRFTPHDFRFGIWDLGFRISSFYGLNIDDFR